MISKSNIESAIILAKQLEKQYPGRSLMVHDGTLLADVLTESVLVCNSIDFDLKDILDGSQYMTLVDDIYDRLTSGVSINDDGVVSDSESHHDIVMDSYVNSLSYSFKRNLEFLKNLVLPNVKELNDLITDEGNRFTSITSDPCYFTIEEAIIPDFFKSEIWQNEPNTPALIPINRSVNLYDSSEATDDESYLAFLRTFKPDLELKDLKTLHDYFDILDRCVQRPSEYSHFSIHEYATLVSLFIALREKPYFKSGKTADENANWANDQLISLYPHVREMLSYLHDEISMGTIISVTTPRINRLVLRSDNPPNIIVHSNNIPESFRDSMTSIVGGILVRNDNRTNLRGRDITEESVKILASSWNNFISSQRQNYSNEQQRDFRNKLVPKVVTFVNEKQSLLSTSFDQSSVEEDVRHRLFELNDFTSNNEIYSTSLQIVCRHIFFNTNAHRLADLDVLFEQDETKDDMQLSLIKLVTDIILSFLCEQIAGRGGR